MRAGVLCLRAQGGGLDAMRLTVNTAMRRLVIQTFERTDGRAAGFNVE
jgi:hypothetical protein